MIFRSSAFGPLSLLAAALAVFAACSDTAPRRPRAIVDLSPATTEDLLIKTLGHRLVSSSGMPEATAFEDFVVEEPYYGATSYVTLFNHVGSHHDPPSHIIRGARSTDDVPLERFYGRARILDFRSLAADTPLGRSHFAERNVAPDDIVVAVVGYTPPTSNDELPSYPYLSAEAAEYLAALPVRMFATDMPSLASLKGLADVVQSGAKGSESVLPEHYALLSREIPVIEGLANLDAVVGEENAVFVGFPLKIHNGNGAPLRAAMLLF